MTSIPGFELSTIQLTSYDIIVVFSIGESNKGEKIDKNVNLNKRRQNMLVANVILPVVGLGTLAILATLLVVWCVKSIFKPKTPLTN